MGEHGRDYIIRALSRETTAAEYLGVLNNLLGQDSLVKNAAAA